MTTDYLSFVDKGQFRDLFQELGWGLPPRGHQNVHVETDYGTLVATPVADQSGLKVWVCVSDRLPGASEQRAVDQAVSKLSQVRLLIFTDGVHQSWRWPRRGATAATNKKLLQHSYTVGNPDQREDLARRLTQIDLPMDDHIGIAEIQERMARAFNEEAVKRSTEASRHMERMNRMLLDAGCSTDTASSLLVRLLFLFFGDDTQMWPEDTFQKWVLNHTTAENFHDKLTELFTVLCDEELDKAQTAGGMGQGTGKYAGSEYQNFRRVNGMYQERVALPSLPEELRQQVLAAGEFDWGKVNPDIFGAMFQQLVDPTELRKHGEHYTSEENIQKVIEPLFLDEYYQRFQNAYDDRNALIDLQDELADLQFIDPACGCGNFLIQAYKHLRGLEYEIIRRAEELELEDIQARLKKPDVRNKRRLISRRDELQAGVSFQFDQQVLRKSKLSMRQFYGIEINSWPAKVASTAMLLVDHLANQSWGENVIRLPIEETPQIVHDNALQVNWEEIVPAKGSPTYVFGNPPFAGARTMSREQKRELNKVWGNLKGINQLDYVTGWHAKSLNFLKKRPGKFAFVTTNSIVQGQPVPTLFGPIFEQGWRISFAHRTFAWGTESPTNAAVHCVIIGFDRNLEARPKLWDYPDNKGKAEVVQVEQAVNAYLVDGPNVLVDSSPKPISPIVTPASFGSMPNDGGNLIVEPEDYAEVVADAVAAEYLRPFRMGRELINNLDRWCLWMNPVNPRDLIVSSILRDRVEKVRLHREGSARGATRALARTPHLFAEIRQPEKKYVGIPAVVSENRPYYTVSHLSPEIIAGNKIYVAVDPDGLLFALISSSMFLTWQRTVGGRLKSDLSFSNTLVWNTFPVPELDKESREMIIKAGQGVLTARSFYPDRSLAELYNPKIMDMELKKAHDALDLAIDTSFGASQRLENERERQQLLFKLYSNLTSK